jgi:hypothetical protein
MFRKIQGQRRACRTARDYEQALMDLDGCVRPMLPGPKPRALLTFIPAPRYTPCCQEPFNVTSERQVYGELDIDSLGPVELRCEILRRTVVKKTGNPNVREVRYLGEPVGQIARSPWVFNTWIASSDRRTPCSSIADASVVVVLDALRSGGAA